MTNDEVYAAGLLIRALDPATQPPEIRAFLSAELELLSEIVGPGTRMIDIGCGTGRHLAFLGERLRLGVGVDYEFTYIQQAQRVCEPLLVIATFGHSATSPTSSVSSFCTIGRWR